MYFPVDKTGVINVGRLLFEYDSDFPVDQQDKSKTPLFSDAQGVAQEAFSGASSEGLDGDSEHTVWRSFLAQAA